MKFGGRDARARPLGFNWWKLGALLILASMTLSPVLAPMAGTAHAQTSNAAGRLLTTISLGNGTSPSSIVYDPANGDLFVAEKDSTNVTVIDGATNRVTANITVSKSYYDNVGGNSEEMVYDPLNGYVYLAASAQEVVYAIDGQSNSVVANVSIPRSVLGGITTAPAGDYIYAANAGSIGPNPASNFPGTISVISASPFALATNFTQDLFQTGIGYDYSNGDLYMGGAHCDEPINSTWVDSAFVVSPSSGTVIATIPLASEVMSCGDTAVLYNPVNQNVYVSVWGGNVLEISGASNQVVANVPVAGGSLGGMAFNPVTADVYVTAGFSGGPSIQVLCGCLNGLTGEGVIGSVDLKGFVEGIAYDASNGDLYATNPLDGTIYVIAVGPASSATSSESITSTTTAYSGANGALQAPQFSEISSQLLFSAFGILIVICLPVTRWLIGKRGGQGVQRPASEATSYPPPPPPDTVMAKCEFCGTEQTWKEVCDRCGARLPKPSVG